MGGKKEDGMKNEVSFSDKIMLLKGIKFFEGLSIAELAVIEMAMRIDYICIISQYGQWLFFLFRHE